MLMPWNLESGHTRTQAFAKNSCQRSFYYNSWTLRYLNSWEVWLASDSDGDLNFKPVSCLNKFKKGPLLEGQQLGNVTADIQRVEAGLLRMQVIPAQPAARPEGENGSSGRKP
ncbi:hypothetical protein CIHG_10028 [Coccidioides immitis H538.4]|uniref:Uncharacterized protein n=2 Tax=Coccidioides immitis TaxID=5501 RepID=A0A0J8S4W2_COCIT|nr:hypothetical protein CIRG_05105 [Coccidioides immitis RMSCC 2394]KMU92167.1 hypothetical protein CIHG_10028 [Coccidioides immitis H538.4]